MKSGTQLAEGERIAFFSARQLLPRRPFALAPAGFEEMTVEHERTEKVLWCRFAFRDRPSFTWSVFRDIARVRAYVDQAFAGAAPGAAAGFTGAATRATGATRSVSATSQRW